MHPRQFTYIAPRNLKEASILLTKHRENSKILAGGQSLIPLMKLRLASPAYVIDIGKIKGLSYIKKIAGQIRIGALTRYAEIESSSLLRSACPILPETVSVIGDPQVRNMGTIGGNIAHADPANDIPPTMLALKAEFVLKKKSTTRTVRANAFFLDLFQTALKFNEVLTEVRIPSPSPRSGGSYLKFERKAGDFAVASVASQLSIDPSGKCNSIGIGLGAVGEAPIEAKEAEHALIGNRITLDLIKEAAALASSASRPTSDLRGSVEFKKHLIKVLAERALATSFGRAGGNLKD
jgi:aerobic carbon-monoxide dehydrogenase medium subunit